MAGSRPAIEFVAVALFALKISDSVQDNHRVTFSTP
jgi:hypothetical protein